MQISDAQREVREAYLNGAVGQLVSGLIWLAASALGTFASHRQGILVLAFGGVCIFPLTVLALKMTGRRGTLPAGHPMNALAMQIAFTVPLVAPVVAAATLHRINWFFPAVSVVVGVHYLPFVFLYGMWQFAVLGALMLGGGILIAMQRPDSFAAAGWLGGALLCAFALWVFPRHLRSRAAKATV